MSVYNIVSSGFISERESSRGTFEDFFSSQQYNLNWDDGNEYGDIRARSISTRLHSTPDV